MAKKESKKLVEFEVVKIIARLRRSRCVANFGNTKLAH